MPILEELGRILNGEEEAASNHQEEKIDWHLDLVKSTPSVLTRKKAQQEADEEEKKEGKEDMQVKKPGRKHAKEKQEEIAGKEKKLGTQTTIENSMGTSIKSIKNHGHTVPPQGGGSEPTSK